MNNISFTGTFYRTIKQNSPQIDKDKYEDFKQCAQSLKKMNLDNVTIRTINNYGPKAPQVTKQELEGGIIRESIKWAREKLGEKTFVNVPENLDYAFKKFFEDKKVQFLFKE